jgi:hypothetical protein
MQPVELFEQRELQISVAPSLPLNEQEQEMKPCVQILHLCALGLGDLSFVKFSPQKIRYSWLDYRASIRSSAS